MNTSRPASAIRKFLELQAAGGILLLAAPAQALTARRTQVMEYGPGCSDKLTGTWLGVNDDAGRGTDLFFERIDHPALADIEID